MATASLPRSLLTNSGASSVCQIHISPIFTPLLVILLPFFKLSGRRILGLAKAGRMWEHGKEVYGFLKTRGADPVLIPNKSNETEVTNHDKTNEVFNSDVDYFISLCVSPWECLG